MAKFHIDKVAIYLGVVRKYMQVRGALSQKELAEATGVGVSTMSRFLSQKTTELNPQLIAKITAHLEIPLHEMIDFVEEDYADHFIRLVKFYKEEKAAPIGSEAPETFDEPSPPAATPLRRQDDFTDAIADGLGGTAKRNITAKIKVGGKTQSIPFGGESKNKMNIKEKIEELTPRQKAYMSDFLNLDMEGRDLVVDLGNDLFRFFRQKGMV